MVFYWYLPFSFTVCPLLCIITCSCYDHVMIVIHINILYSLKAVDCLLFFSMFQNLFVHSLFPCVSFALSSLSSAVQSLFLHCIFGNPCVRSWRVGNELTWSCRNSLVLTQVYHGVIIISGSLNAATYSSVDIPKVRISPQEYLRVLIFSWHEYFRHW